MLHHSTTQHRGGTTEQWAVVTAALSLLCRRKEGSLALPLVIVVAVVVRFPLSRVGAQREGGEKTAGRVKGVQRFLQGRRRTYAALR